MKNNKWLIGTDLDGTLLGDKTKSVFNLPQKNKEVIDSLVKKGHIHAIVTGRQWEFVKPLYEAIGAKGPVILNNGSRIYDPNGDIDHRYYINMKIVKEMFEFAQTKVKLRTFVLVADETTFIDKAVNGFGIEFEKHAPTTEVKVENFDNLGQGVMAGVIGVDGLTEDNFHEFEDELIERFGDKLNITRFRLAHDRFDFQFYSSETNKYIACEKLAELTGVHINNIITFGDQMNDYEMIRDSAVGVAMQNANPLLKEVATQITQYTNEEAGVGKHLELFFKK